MRGERVKVNKSRTLARRGRSERERGKEGVDSTVKKSRFQREERGHAKIASLGKVEKSMSG